MSLNPSAPTGTLDALTNVKLTNPATGDVLTYTAPANGQLGYWSNEASPTGGAGSTVAVAGAATLNTPSGVVTSEALASATGYVLTLSNSLIKAGSVVLVNVTESTGAALVTLKAKVVTAGQVVVTVSMAALSGTLEFDFIVAN